jgi:uncharacterized protein
MRLWLDMANSPHPVLLAPLARELQRRGHEIAVTTRDHAQTLELTRTHWPQAAVVGGESPGSRAAKARSIARRVVQLRTSVAKARPDVAVSLGSYAQIVAARTLGTRVLTLMDYEFQPANHLSFRLADCIAVPTVFPQEQLRRFGALRRRVARFDGFKEEMYLDQLSDADAAIERTAQVRVIFRPPPEGALYHQTGNASFEDVLAHAVGRDDIEAIVLPRTGEQRARYSRMRGVLVPSRAVDGLALLRSADLFIGAGGTMSREAALLGVRAYTLFAGRLAAVDADLMRRGLLSDLRGRSAQTVDWSPRSSAESANALDTRRARGHHLRGWLADRIEELV